MNRPRVVWYLRIAFSAVCGIACVLLAVLWLRSYWRFDYVSGMATASRQVEIFAIKGRLAIGTWAETTMAPWGHRSNPVAESQSTLQILERHENAIGFGIVKPSVVMPYYFVVFVAGVFATLPWLRWRFSLRTLLIATTSVAVVLGAIVYLVR
jgi:hypothetical protein